MGFLSGLGGIFGIGGSGTEAKNNAKRARWNPPQISMPGYTSQYQLGKGPKGVDQATYGFDANNTALRNGYYGAAGQGLMGLLQPQANVGGYGGISPELYGEFGTANAESGALPPQFYDQAGFNSLLQGAGQAGQNSWAEYNNLMANGGAGNYGHWLDVMRQQAQPYEDRYLQGGMDQQFLKGIMASTAGQYQTQGMMDSLNTADLQRQQAAFGMSQEAANNALARAQGASGVFSGMEGDATNRGFLLNQLNGTRAADRFQRAMALFGTGQGANQQAQARSLAQLGAGGGGISAQDQQLMSMLGLQGQLGAARSGANLGAGQMMTNYNMGQQGMWGNMISSALGGGGKTPT
jgi:hypothetical protein